MFMKRITALALITALIPTMALHAQERLKPVKIMTVEAGVPAQQRQFFGQVFARQSVDLAFQVSGQLVDFPVIEGEMIPKGALIAQLDLETFELTLEQAKLQQDQAKRTLERLQQLSNSSASQVRIDDAATSLALADVTVKNAQYALDHATLSAPFDALVASREIANFTTVNAGTPAVRLHDMSEIHIEVDVPEVLFLRTGPKSGVSFIAKFPFSDEEFPLTLREFNAEASDVGQSFRVTLGMNPPEGVRVLPGASATVVASGLKQNSDEALLPNSAVFIDEVGVTSVMIFTPDTAKSTEASDGQEIGKVHIIPVVVSPLHNAAGLVVSGLEPDVEIVSVGGAALADGQSVRRFAGFGN